MSYPDFDDLDHVHDAVDEKPYVSGSPAWMDIRNAAGGTCSDFVLGYLGALLDLGWPIETLRIGICFVEPENRVPGETHAILVVDDDHVLDERQVTVCSVDALNRISYEPIEIQETGGSRAFVQWLWNPVALSSAQIKQATT